MNVQTVSFQGLSFINIANPTDFEMKYLKNTYYFNPLNLEDYAHKTQIPKVENHRKYDLVVLRFPLFSENVPQNSHQYGVHLPTFRSHIKKRRLMSSYVNFFVSKEYVVVLHGEELPQINHIFSLCQQTLHGRTEYMSKGSVFLVYRIIDALVDNCFPVINEITSTIERIDKELEGKQTQKTLEDISATRRDLVVFHTMLKPVLSLFGELEKGKHEKLNGAMQPFWGNISDHLQKILDRLDDNQELIEGIARSNESFIMTRTNVIIKLLTVITVIIMPLQLLSGIYGMNIVGLPFAQNPWAFEIHLLIMLAVAIPLVTILKIKRWF